MTSVEDYHQKRQVRNLARPESSWKQGVRKMDTLLLVSCRQKRLTRRLQDQTTSVPQRDTAPLCQKRHTRKAAKKMERHETACQKAFCQSVAHHCVCPPPARRLCAHLLGNLPWCRPAGPSWPLEADRKSHRMDNCWHGESMDTVWQQRHQLSNQMCTLLPLLLRTRPWLGRTPGMPSHDCEGVKKDTVGCFHLRSGW